VKGIVEDETTRGIASSLYPYIGRNSTKIVYRPGDAQRHYRVVKLTKKFHSNLLV
jgi:hypothetical protein